MAQEKTPLEIYHEKCDKAFAQLQDDLEKIASDFACGDDQKATFYEMMMWKALQRNLIYEDALNAARMEYMNDKVE